MTAATPTASERVAAYLGMHDKFAEKQTSGPDRDNIHGYNGNTPLLASDLRALLAENARLNSSLQSMQAVFHTNMLRAFPDKSHAEISAEIDKSLAASGVVKATVQPEVFAWHYMVNGTYPTYSSVKPPDDAYDAGTLVPLGRIVEAQPATAMPEVVKDAERYQFLCRKVAIAGGKFHILNLAPTYCAPRADIELDSVIDAQILAEKEAK